MLRIFIAIIFVFCLLVSPLAQAEIDFSKVDAGMGVYASEGSTTLNEENPKATVTDSAGGMMDVNYDSTTSSYDLDCTSGSVSATYSIAKIYLDQGESINIQQTEGLDTFILTNIAGDVEVVFPDGSRITLGPNSAVSLTMTADNNFQLNVIEGEVAYTDPNGVTTTLGVGSSPVLVQGFTTIPDWRETEVKRNPATP